MIAIDDGARRRVFLFLQGPHGPFFRQLARMLRSAGASCWRVGYNRGDAVFWGDPASYIPFTAAQEDWPGTFTRLLAEKSVTDIVLYGDTRQRPTFDEHFAVAARAAGLSLERVLQARRSRS